MACVGTIGASITKHPRSLHDEGILLYNNVEAHVSHTMATSGAMRIHFCVACGAYGGMRSKHLKVPCPHKATKAGREALQAIARGVRPNIAAHDHYKKYGHKPRPLSKPGVLKFSAAPPASGKESSQGKRPVEIFSGHFDAAQGQSKRSKPHQGSDILSPSGTVGLGALPDSPLPSACSRHQGGKLECVGTLWGSYLDCHGSS